MGKRIVSIELTAKQLKAIEELGKVLWPGQSLLRSELCRRILLAEADGQITADLRNYVPRRRLLEPECVPVGGSIREEVPEQSD